MQWAWACGLLNSLVLNSTLNMGLGAGRFHSSLKVFYSKVIFLKVLVIAISYVTQKCYIVYLEGCSTYSVGMLKYFVHFVTVLDPTR